MRMYAYILNLLVHEFVFKHARKPYKNIQIYANNWISEISCQVIISPELTTAYYFSHANRATNLPEKYNPRGVMAWSYQFFPCGLELTH